MGNVIDEDKIRKQKKKLGGYFTFFVITTLISMTISDNTPIGKLFSILAAISLVVLVVKAIQYREAAKRFKIW